MTRFERLLLVGAILISIGLLILSLDGQETEGFFVVFPFVFIGNVNPFLVMAVLVAMLVAFYLSFKWMIQSSMQGFQPRGYESLTKRCSNCGEYVAKRALFCPVCGNPIDYQQND